MCMRDFVWGPKLLGRRLWGSNDVEAYNKTFRNDVEDCRGFRRCPDLAKTLGQQIEKLRIGHIYCRIAALMLQTTRNLKRVFLADFGGARRSSSALNSSLAKVVQMRCSPADGACHAFLALSRSLLAPASSNFAPLLFWWQQNLLRTLAVRYCPLCSSLVRFHVSLEVRILL